MYVYISVFSYIYICIYVSICVGIYTIYVGICAYICINKYVYICENICSVHIYVYTRIYVKIYVHTYINSKSYQSVWFPFRASPKMSFVSLHLLLPPLFRPRCWTHSGNHSEDQSSAQCWHDLPKGSQPRAVLALLKPSLLIVSTFQGIFFSSLRCSVINFSKTFSSFSSFLTSAWTVLSSASVSLSSGLPSFLSCPSSLSRSWASSRRCLHWAQFFSKSSRLCWTSAVLSSRACGDRRHKQNVVGRRKNWKIN